MESLWQCGFIYRRVITWKGIRYAFVLVFIHVKTRQVMLSPATLHPTQDWTVRQARARGLRVSAVQHDRDKRFSKVYRQALRRDHVVSNRNMTRAPMMNAFVERFIKSLQQECLDHFVIFGTRHLNLLGREYLAHYHKERPQQSLGNAPIQQWRTESETEVVPMRKIKCRQRLGGLLKSYSRKAA